MNEDAGSSQSFTLSFSQDRTDCYQRTDAGDIPTRLIQPPLVFHPSQPRFYAIPSIISILISYLNDLRNPCCHCVRRYRISGFFVLNHSSLLDVVGSLPLRRLHCRLEDLFMFQPIDLAHQLFSRLTHLELFPGDTPTSVAWAGLAALPNLNHLSFSGLEFLRLVLEFVWTCKSLRVLIFLFEGSEPPLYRVRR